MLTIKHFYLLFLLTWSCASALFAQTCPATISPNGPPPICQGQSVMLRANTNTGLNLSYQWLRDGTEIAGATLDSLVASQSGNYAVRVSGTTCTATTSIPVTVTVNPVPPQPDFIINPNTALCSGTAIVFDITNPQANESYVWDFGDGTEAIGSQVTHTYQETGAGTANFEVKVYSNAAGCISPIRSRIVGVNRLPAFTAPRDSASFNVCIPDNQDTIKVKAVLFNTVPVPADIVSYVVDFGDGSGEHTFLPAQFTDTIAIRNFIAYDTTGTFPITIRARGSNGCETVFTRGYQINKKPEAKFSAQKDRVSPAVPPKDCIPVKVTVDSDSTSGGNVSYKWSVKNNTGQDAGPSIYKFIETTSDTSASPILEFGVPGRYNLELIVTNTCGSDTTSQSLLIGYPEIRMNADTTSCGPTILNFNDELVNVDPNLGTIDENSYQWTITGTGGATAVDGTSLKVKNPKISFPNPGTYEVRLVVSNECGASDAVEQQGGVARITINPIPAAPTIAVTGVTLCAGDTTSIQPSGPGTNFAFYSSQTVATPFFTGRAYNPGPLTASATYYVATQDAKGCESTSRVAFTITVVAAITNNTISQTEDQKEVCAGQTITRALSGPQPSGGSGSRRFVWETSTTGNTTGFGPASGDNSNRTYTPPALTATTWFRRVAIIGDCRPDTSNVLMIQVNPAITDNTINVVNGSGNVLCEGQPAPEITGSQVSAAAVIVWESSITSGNAADFSPAPGANNTADYAPGMLPETTWFRRRVTSGGCIDISPAVEITVNPRLTNNTISESQDICSATTIPAPLIGSIPRWGGGVLVYLWESSLTGSDEDFAPAPGTNNQTNYNPPAISQTTWFRRSITSGSCPPVRSNEIRLTFVPPIENNTIQATQTTVCDGGLPTLTGTLGNRGVVFLWETSTTSATTGFNPALGSNNGKNYTPPAFNQNTWYRRTVKPSNADCPPVPSNVIGITLEALPAAPAVEAADVAVCQGTSATLQATVNGGNLFEWYTSPTGGSPVFFGQQFITPRLTANTTYYVQAVSANQCASTGRTAVRVSVLTISADAGRDTTIIAGQTMALQAKGGTQYQWSPAAGLNNAGIANPVASPAKTTTYQVRVTNELGCEATDAVTITVIPRVLVINTFSPNQDGINETWEIANIENFPEATVEIFNRWGNPVFKSAGAYRPWDGTYNGSPLPLATYYYIIRLNKDEKPLSGSVTIIR